MTLSVYKREATETGATKSSHLTSRGPANVSHNAPASLPECTRNGAGGTNARLPAPLVARCSGAVGRWEWDVRATIAADVEDVRVSSTLARSNKLSTASHGYMYKPPN